MKEITDFKVEDHGVEHHQYFRGAGVAYTTWESVYTGVGDNFNEALDDALDILAYAAEFAYSKEFETRVKEATRGWGGDSISTIMSAAGEDEDSEDEDSEAELYYYVSLFVK